MRRSALAIFVLTGAVSSEAIAQEHTELGLVPIAGGNTDLGAGGGVIGSIARVDPDVRPYLWRAEFVALALYKDDVFPYTDVYVQLSLPSDGYRFTTRLGFTRAMRTGWYGIGNASPDDPSQIQYYDRLRPHFRADGLVRLGGPIWLRASHFYAHNFLDIDPHSKLAADLASKDPDTRALVRAPNVLGVPQFLLGIVLDTRDDELVTTSGMHHELSARAVPVTFGDAQLHYGGASLTLRFFAPIISGDLVFAARFTGDVLAGDPPVFELTTLEDRSMLGGEYGVRGVPAQRYAGYAKALSNLELRARLAEYEDFAAGVVFFFDTGRVFSQVPPTSKLDGDAIGLAWGTGGGLRFQWGKTFVLRADVAYSPDAHPIGAYLTAGELF